MLFIWLLLLLFSGSALADTNVGFKLMSDYTDEGLTQSNGKVSFMVEAERVEDVGFYYGFRALRVDMDISEESNDAYLIKQSNKINTEWNTFAGYRWSNDDIDFDLGAIVYTYSNNSIQHQNDFTEYYFNVDFNNGHSSGLICSYNLPANPPDELSKITQCIVTYGYIAPALVSDVDVSLEVNFVNSLDGAITPWGNYDTDNNNELDNNDEMINSYDPGESHYLHTKLSFSRVLDDVTVFIDFENTWLNDKMEEQGGGFRTVVGLSYAFTL